MQAGCRAPKIPNTEKPTKRPTEAAVVDEENGINDNEVERGDEGMKEVVGGDDSAPTMMPVASEEDELQDTTSGGNVIQVTFASLASIAT